MLMDLLYGREGRCIKARSLWNWAEYRPAELSFQPWDSANLIMIERQSTSVPRRRACTAELEGSKRGALAEAVHGNQGKWLAALPVLVSLAV